MMNETPITLSEDTTGEVLAGGNLSAPLDRVAIHSVSQQSRYSRYSSNFLPYVLIRIYTHIYYFFWSIARLGDAPLADGRIRVILNENIDMRTQKSSLRIKPARGRAMHRMHGRKA